MGSQRATPVKPDDQRPAHAVHSVVAGAPGDARTSEAGDTGAHASSTGRLTKQPEPTYIVQLGLTNGTFRCRRNSGRCSNSGGTIRMASSSSEQLAKMNLHGHDLRREAGSRLLERGADLHTVQLFLDHANISTSSRYLKPSKLALHTTIQRIDAQRRESGEAAKWEQDLAELRKNLPQGPQKGPHADRIVRQREVG
ncbi:MAG: hypothetical protein DMF91_27980, partial [Acidobacteria bacterium]